MRSTTLLLVPSSEKGYKTGFTSLSFHIRKKNNGGSMPKKLSRRDFLRTSAAVAAPMIVPASVFGGAGRVAPADRLGIGPIGVGTMGYGHVKGPLGEKAVQIFALC